MLGRWTLSVPVKRPIRVSVLNRLGQASAVLAIALAWYWQSRNGAISALAAVVAIAAALGCSWLSRKRMLAVHGLYLTPDAASWLILLDSGWQPVGFLACHQGAFWLTVSVRLRADTAQNVANPIITFSIWRFTLHDSCWRRLCLVGRAMQREAPPVMFHQEAL